MEKQKIQYNNIKIIKSREVLITLFVMFILVAFSGIMAGQISAMEEQECWNALEQTAQYTANELKNQIYSDQELLESISNIIQGMDSLYSPSVQKIIDEF